MGRLILLLGVALLVVTGAHTSALAQAAAGQKSSGKDEEARGLFWAGRAAYDQGRYDDALGYFSRSYQLSGRPELLYNIGQAADRLRKDREALDAFTEYLNRVPETPNRETVEARIRLLRRAIEEREQEVQAAKVGAAAPAEATKESAGTQSVQAQQEPEEKVKQQEPEAKPPEPAPTSAPAQPEVLSKQDHGSGSAAPVDREQGSIWSKWWLWTAVAGVVAAGVVIGVVAARAKDERQGPSRVGTGIVVTGSNAAATGTTMPTTCGYDAPRSGCGCILILLC